MRWLHGSGLDWMARLYTRMGALNLSLVPHFPPRFGSVSVHLIFIIRMARLVAGWGGKVFWSFFSVRFSSFQVDMIRISIRHGSSLRLSLLVTVISRGLVLEGRLDGWAVPLLVGIHRRGNLECCGSGVGR